MSSYCVAEVEYESCADELRLWGGDAMLIKPSEFLDRAADLPSPLPLRRLPVLPENWYVGVVGVFDFRDKPPAESGLGGKLVSRPSPRGGCGNEFMLTDFRNVLDEALMEETARGWGSPPAGDAVELRKLEALDGVRRTPDFGVDGIAMLVERDSPPTDFRVLPIGSAGRAELGGPFDSRAGFGTVVDIVRCEDIRQGCLQILQRPLSDGALVVWLVYRRKSTVSLMMSMKWVLVTCTTSEETPTAA